VPNDSQTVPLWFEALSARPIRRTRVWIAVWLFLISLLIRCIGIGWGLPNENRHQSLHPDELITAAAAYSNPYFKPGFYNYGSLYLTVLKLGSNMGESYGWVPTGENVETWRTLRGIELTGRVISAISGAAAVSIVFLLALFVTNLFGAAVAAFCMMTAPGMVVHSRFETVDAFSTMMIALALYFVCLLSAAENERKLRLAAGAGLLIGLAAGSKYLGALLLIPGLTACRGALLRTGLALTGAAVAGFLAATPGVLLEWPVFARDFGYELGHSAQGHGLVFVSTPSGFLYHPVVNFPAAMGLGASVLGIAGLIWAAVKRPQVWILLLLFFAAFFLVIGRAEVKFMRYAFPLVLILTIGVGYLTGELHAKGGKARWAAALCGVFLLFGITAPTGVVEMTNIMTQPDARDVCGEWVSKNLPAEATIGFVNDPWFYSPTLFPDTDELDANRRLDSMRKQSPRLLRYVPPSGPRIEWDSRLVTELHPDYIVFSSFEFYDHDRLNEPEFEKTIQLICKEYRLRAEFWGGHIQAAGSDPNAGIVSRSDLRALCRQAMPEPHDMMYIRPVVWLFQKSLTR